MKKITIQMKDGSCHEYEGEEAEIARNSIEYGERCNLRFVSLTFKRGFSMLLNLNNVLFTWESDTEKQ